MRQECQRADDAARENRVHVWARRILVFCRDDMNRHRDQIQDTFVGELQMRPQLRSLPVKQLGLRRSRDDDAQ